MGSAGLFSRPYFFGKNTAMTFKSDTTNHANGGIISAAHQAVIALWYEVNMSLSAYYKLVTAYGDAKTAIQASASDWQALGIHKSHVSRHQKPNETDSKVAAVIQSVAQKEYALVFADEQKYPAQLLQMYDPPPLLFYLGNISRLSEPQIAMVGSRKPTQHAQTITYDMAQYLAGAGFVITSGLAQGVDKQAHLGALAQSQDTDKGRTVGVMGTGIDVCYPKNHAKLFAQIIDEGGCLITELLPNTPATQHNFPRRNRLVAGLSLGTIVTEAALKSGSLITARLTSEQGKQVFAIPSHIHNVNAEGCHHLIREGATLVYHPEQVIEDLQSQQLHSQRISSQNLSAQPQKLKDPSYHEAGNEADSQNAVSVLQSTSAHFALETQVDIPSHLQALYQQLDWHGQDVDTLHVNTQIPPAELLGQLMELELLGLIGQQGGRYLRV